MQGAVAANGRERWSIPRGRVPAALVLAALSGSGCLGSAPPPPDRGSSETDAGPAGELPDLSSGSSEARYHPAGFAAREVHGLELKQQQQDCRACHGQDLSGTATAPSCDTCHTPGTPGAWRTQCTFCHGGVDDQSGAPPRHLDGSSDPARARFAPHGVHVSSALTAAIDCVQCHVKATDVLSPGHVFDSTPGVAETDLGGGTAKQGSWERGSGTCANNYCHGAGRLDDGVVMASAGPRTCTSCHPGAGSSAAAIDAMSGLHRAHLQTAIGGAISCGDCHNATTQDGATILSAPANLHLDGQRQVVFATANAAIRFDAAKQECTGTCHGFPHNNPNPLRWLNNGKFHPAGWVAAKGQTQPHGVDLELGRYDCRACHGAELKGLVGSQVQTCDQCHAANGSPAWRTTCTFCHGSVGGTGAPPRDLGAAAGTASQSFVSHGPHLAGRISPTWTCTQCHVQPGGVDPVLAAGHVFPGDGAAEVTLAGSLRPAGTAAGSYAAGTCTNLYCHGNGRANNGSYTDGSAAPSCGGCHPGMASGSTAWATMSGDHRRHLGKGDIDCGDCHAEVTSDGVQLIGKALHLNAIKNVRFKAATISFSGGRCTGACHNKNHSNQSW